MKYKAIWIANAVLFVTLLVTALPALLFGLGVSYTYEISALTYTMIGVLVAMLVTGVLVFYCARKAHSLSANNERLALFIALLPTLMIALLFWLVNSPLLVVNQ